MELTPEGEKPRCKGVKKDGTPCPAWPTNNVTQGYCFGHDPGITSEMRSGFAKGSLNIPKLTGRRRLQTIDDLKEWAEEMVYDIEQKYPNSIEVVEVKINIARLLLTAIREENEAAEKKAKNRGASGAFRMKGAI